MLRQLVILVITGSIAVVANAGDPTRRAISVRIPLGDSGDGGSDGDGAIFDLFEIRHTLEKLQEREERPTIVLDKSEIDELRRQDLELRNSDPNLAGSISSVGPESLRGELRPTDKNDLFSTRIRTNGNGAPNDRVQGPADPNKSPVSLRRSGDH